MKTLTHPGPGGLGPPRAQRGGSGFFRYAALLGGLGGGGIAVCPPAALPGFGRVGFVSDEVLLKKPFRRDTLAEAVRAALQPVAASDTYNIVPLRRSEPS